MTEELQHGFKKVQTQWVDDIGAEVVEYYHPQSGGRVMWVNNDDPNRTFGIGFLTPPTDSTGVAHIVEHSVLSGSQKYPVKDPFMHMMKTSMQTFLNALTFADMTVYPLSSMNETDFHHLMGVYLDAVFYPKMLTEEKIFRQEGWHKELFQPEDDLTINGVVYNEMRGAFGDVDRAIMSSVAEHLHPESTYAHESGGNPYVIPELSYEDFCAFHQTHYRPDNALAFLYGDIDIDRALAQINKGYFDAFEADHHAIELTLPTPPKGRTKETVYYSADKQMSRETDSYLTYTVPFTSAQDKQMTFILQLLGDVLVDAEASPLRAALVDTGFAEDVSAYPSDGYYQDFGIVVENMSADQADQIVDIIEKTLRQVVKDGLDQSVFDGVLNSREFYYRQAGGSMQGITRGIQMLSVWRYQDQPLDGLTYSDELDYIRQRRDQGMFEQLLTDRVLNAETTQVLVHEPKVGLFRSQDDALAEKLAAEKAQLSAEDVQELIKQNESLRAYQTEPDTPEAIATLPQLDLADVPRETTNIPEEILSNNPTILFHPHATSGVRYVKLAFASDDMTREEIPYLKDLAILLGSVDTQNMTYQDLDTELMKATARLGIVPKIYTAVDNPDDYTVQMEVNFAALNPKTARGFELTTDILTKSLFTQKQRILNVFKRVKLEMEQSFEANGHQAALGRVRSLYSNPSRYAEELSGIGYYDHLTHLINHFDTEWETFKHQLEQLNQRLWTQSRLTISLTGESADKDAFYHEVKEFIETLPVGETVVRHPMTFDFSNIRKEAIITNSNVQYVAQGGYFPATDYEAPMLVLSAILSKGYLYDLVRLQGGAYGAGLTISRTGDMTAYSYRDPNVDQTIATYQAMSDFVANLELDQETLNQFIIGTMSSFHYPISPDKVNRIMLTRYFKGSDKSMIDKRLIATLNTTVADLMAYVDLIRETMAQGYTVVIGNEQQIKQATFVFDNVRELKQ